MLSCRNDPKQQSPVNDHEEQELVIDLGDDVEMVNEESETNRWSQSSSKKRQGSGYVKPVIITTDYLIE